MNILLQGELKEHEKLVRLIKQVDVVISVLPYPQILEQLKIIDAMKVAGNVKVVTFSTTKIIKRSFTKK